MISKRGEIFNFYIYHLKNKISSSFHKLENLVLLLSYSDAKDSTCNWAELQAVFAV